MLRPSFTSLAISTQSVCHLKSNKPVLMDCVPSTRLQDMTGHEDTHFCCHHNHTQAGVQAKKQKQTNPTTKFMYFQPPMVDGQAVAWSQLLLPQSRSNLDVGHICISRRRFTHTGCSLFKQLLETLFLLLHTRQLAFPVPIQHGANWHCSEHQRQTEPTDALQPIRISLVSCLEVGLQHVHEQEKGHDRDRDNKAKLPEKFRRNFPAIRSCWIAKCGAPHTHSEPPPTEVDHEEHSFQRYTKQEEVGHDVVVNGIEKLIAHACAVREPADIEDGASDHHDFPPLHTNSCPLEIIFDACHERLNPSEGRVKSKSEQHHEEQHGHHVRSIAEGCHTLSNRDEGETSSGSRLLGNSSGTASRVDIVSNITDD
mmetsp:Transcript_116617/g.375401  ORF Transcript_116617/g.375401 Transcript_116617/m.375401 type:complete len:369 (+) Transcript_116617:171-1277(+)